jgi:hypothetical protein
LVLVLHQGQLPGSMDFRCHHLLLRQQRKCPGLRHCLCSSSTTTTAAAGTKSQPTTGSRW